MWSWTNNGERKRNYPAHWRLSLDVQDDETLTETEENAGDGQWDISDEGTVPEGLAS